MKEILFVGAGSAAGGILRYLSGKGLTLIFPYPFPLGTFVINILGSLAIGYIYGMASRGTTQPGLFLFLTTGFCGGFTTFSAFSLENIHLIRNNNWQQALVYTGASLAFGLLATFIGISLVKNI